MKDLLLPVRLEFLILSLNPGLRHRCVALPVGQGEALGDKPHMRSGGLGGARCDLNGRRPQSPAQHRGVDPVDAVLCQQFGDRPRSFVCASFFSARCTSNRTEEGLPARSEIVPPVPSGGPGGRLGGSRVGGRGVGSRQPAEQQFRGFRGGLAVEGHHRISCSTARVCPSSEQASGPPRNTVAAAGVAGGSSTLASISPA